MRKENKSWMAGLLLVASSLLFCNLAAGAEDPIGGAGENAVNSINEVPVIEAQIVEALTKNGAKGSYVISDIRPIGASPLRGKICIAGSGKLPIAKDTSDRPGKDVVLEWIYPLRHGDGLNMLKTKAGIMFQRAGTDYSSIYSAGAVWQTIPRLFEKEKFDPLCGVALAEGVRLGSLYEGDGNLMFDYVRAGGHVVLFPAGTEGSIHRFMGEITIGRYVFASDNDPLNPLTFLLTKDGYVYIRGKGTVTLPSGEKVQLSTVAPQVHLKAVLEPTARLSSGARLVAANDPAPRPLRPDIINDLAALKLLCVVVRLDRLGLLPVALSSQMRKSLADRLVELHEKYRITSATQIHSDMRTWGCNPGSAGPTLFVEMKKGCEILRIETEGLPLVRLGGGKIQMNLQSLAISFEEGAEAVVGESKYRCQNGVWRAVTDR